MTALKRIANNTIDKRLLNSRGQPNFNVCFYALSAQGNFAGVTLYESSGKGPVRFAVCNEDGPSTLPAEPLFSGPPQG
jgi:hypothetical protein